MWTVNALCPRFHHAHCNCNPLLVSYSPYCECMESHLEKWIIELPYLSHPCIIILEKMMWSINWQNYNYLLRLFNNFCWCNLFSPGDCHINFVTDGVEWNRFEVLWSIIACHLSLTSSFHSFCITLFLDIKGLRLQWAHLEDIRAIVSEGGYLNSFLLFSPLLPFWWTCIKVITGGTLGTLFQNILVKLGEVMKELWSSWLLLLSCFIGQMSVRKGLVWFTK